jgi:hypothetical protein
MKRVRGGFGIVGLFVFLLVIIAFLPSIRSMFAPSFPEGFKATQNNAAAMAKNAKEGFRNVDCKGVLCNEGEFCQDNICRPVAAPITNNYFSGR